MTTLQITAAAHAADVRLEPTLDGDATALAGQLRFLFDVCSFDTLDALAAATAHWVAISVQRGRIAATESVAVDLREPATDATATAQRRCADVRFRTDHQSFGDVDVVFETSSCGIYLERLHPRAVLPTHRHLQLDEHELVLDEGLVLQGEPVRPGLAHRWPRGHPHRYENSADEQRSFLCVDAPAFIPTDERRVSVPVEQLRRTPATRYF